MSPRLMVRSERGQALVEYGLLVALITVICVVSLVEIGDGIQNVMQRYIDALSS